MDSCYIKSEYRHFELKEFIKDANKKYCGFYKYDDVDWKGIDQYIEIKCMLHKTFRTMPVKHLEGKYCPDCPDDLVFKPKELFIYKSKVLHGNRYKYIGEYINQYTETTLMCRVHGEFNIVPYQHMRGVGCPKCNHPSIYKKI